MICQSRQIDYAFLHFKSFKTNGAVFKRKVGFKSLAKIKNKSICQFSTKAFYLGTEHLQPVINVLIASVNLLYIVDNAGSIGTKCSN